MGAAVLSQAEFGNGGSVAQLTLRQRCELIRAQAEQERVSFISHWKELNDFILPRRGRFYVSDVNKGDRRSRNIYDSTATLSAGTLSAGLMSSVTSPSRPWFHLTTSDSDLNDLDAVKQWLHVVNELMEEAFVRSNLYDELAVFYLDLGVFGTAAMMELDDDEQVFRFRTFPIGEYAVANDAKNRVRTFVRTFRMSVLQIVEQWGEMEDGVPNFARGKPTTISKNVQNLYARGAMGVWIDVAHLIQENRAYDAKKIDAKFKRFESITYEVGAPGATLSEYLHSGVLEHSGYDEFPVYCARWSVIAGDVYATNCPGMTSLGDIKELQVRTKRTAQAEEKMLNPPMVAPSSMRTAKASMLPGDVNYVDRREGMQGFAPAYEVNFGASFAAMEQKCEQIRQRIKRTYYENLFLMLEQLDRNDMTATEVSERKEEKLLALGPLLGRLNQDLLDQLINRSFAIMLRKNLFPPPPEELQGQLLHVEYLSVLAQALKTAGVSMLDRAAGFVAQVAQVDQGVLDVVDTDEMVRTYFDSLGVPPKVLRSEDDVTQLRKQRQQAAATQQAAENAPGLAGAAKDLGQAPTTGNNVLADLVAKSRARASLSATASPVQSPA